MNEIDISSEFNSTEYVNRLKARKNDCRLKAVKIIDNAGDECRFLTEEENKELKRLEEEMKSSEKQIVRLKAVKGMTKKELEQENAELNWTLTIYDKALCMILEKLGFTLIDREKHIWLGCARDELLSNDDVEEIDVDKL